MNQRKVFTLEVTPTVSSGAAYTANDQVGGLQTLTGFCLREYKAGTLINVAVTDKAKQSAAMTIFLFDASPTVASSDNAALDVTDAEMADKCVGAITIAAGDYASVANSSVATKAYSYTWVSQTTGGTLYAVAMTTGTPTYGSTSDLVFKYTFCHEG